MDPFYNRDKIAKVAKGSKGIYIFEVINEQMVYVGSSINLYNRVCSYFMPSLMLCLYHTFMKVCLLFSDL